MSLRLPSQNTAMSTKCLTLSINRIHPDDLNMSAMQKQVSYTYFEETRTENVLFCAATKCLTDVLTIHIKGSAAFQLSFYIINDLNDVSHRRNKERG